MGAQLSQGVVRAPALVAGQVIVGVQQVDELAQMEADAAQLRCPAILPVVEQLCHQSTEAAGHRVKVSAAGGLVLGKLCETRTDGIALPRPAQGGLGGAVVQQGAVPQCQQIMVILPFVLRVVVM